ncbi:multiple PDZ domain protein-like [Glandiceps talaboti]
MVLARGGIPSVSQASPSLDRTPSVVSSTSQQSAALSGSPDQSTVKWEHVETITLHNDGTGLGFGIVGGRSTGVVVKTILPGGVADRDGHLRSGDHILKISETSLSGMNSEQVAAVLRQSGTTVTLTIARNAVIEQHNIQQVVPVAAAAVPRPSSPQPRDEPVQQHQQQPIETEAEVFDVELVKDSKGLGITIAGYVGQDINADIAGIFVKSVLEGSTADRDGRIQVNDQIVEVDGQSLQGFNNKEAVDVLRQTGSTVQLRLARYPQGMFVQPSPPPPPSLSEFEPPGPPAAYLLTNDSENEDDMPPNMPPGYYDDVYIGDLTPEAEAGIIAHWQNILDGGEVAVAQISKFREGGGLGISLEGTVDIEDGAEVRPHHYIRSILPDGPVGQNGKLESGDELLEVNGTQLLGLNHVDVISILKELPMHVRIVVARHAHPIFPDVIDTDPPASPGPIHPQLTSSEPNLLASSIPSEGMFKAHSEMTLPMTEMKPPRTLETATGLAMWSDEPTEIILNKGDRGLGFSILDYQDPTNPAETVIVIRSLVPAGVAGEDGRLIPGDRLVYVNDTTLENCSLERAVQALKGAPQGPVRIGVAKPLPVPNAVLSDQIPTPLRELGVAAAPLNVQDIDQDMEVIELMSPDLIQDKEQQQLDTKRREASLPTVSKTSPDDKEQQESIEIMTREARMAMNQYSVATGEQEKTPTPPPPPPPPPEPTSAPMFRAPPPLFYSSSEELEDEEDEDTQETLKPSVEEQEKIEKMRREAMMAMNMYATATGQSVEVSKPQPIRPPSAQSSPPPPQVIDTDKKKEEEGKIAAARREAAMAMNAFAVATGKPIEAVSQPSPEPEPVPELEPKLESDPEEVDEEDERIEAMRRDAMMAMNAFAIATGQSETQDMDVVSATPVMIEVKRLDDKKADIIEKETTHDVEAVQVESIPLQIDQVRHVDSCSSRSSTTSVIEDEEYEMEGVKEDKLFGKIPIPDPSREEGVDLGTVEQASISSTSSSSSKSEDVTGEEIGSNFDVDVAINEMHVGTNFDPHGNTNDLHASIELSSVSSDTSHTSFSASSDDQQGIDVDAEPLHADVEFEHPITTQTVYGAQANLDIDRQDEIEAVHVDVEFERPSEVTDEFTPAVLQDSDDSGEYEFMTSPPPLPDEPPPPLPDIPPPDLGERGVKTPEESFQEPISVMPVAPVAMATLERQEDAFSSRGSTPVSSPNMLDRKASVILPEFLERTIRIKKGNAGLGFITAAEKGNGVIVKTITKGGIIDKDGHLVVGDYITAVNSESMRDLTNSQARSLLRRCSLIGTDIRITYIPGEEASQYVDNPESFTPPTPTQQEVTFEDELTVQQSISVYSAPKVFAVPSHQSEVTEFPDDDYGLQQPLEVTPTQDITMATGRSSQTPPPVPKKPKIKTLHSDGSPAIMSVRWDPVRSVELLREPNRSLGISIVGGRVGEGSIAQGIFIKHVLEDSPAGNNGTLKTGDRILEVNGQDLRSSSHDHAVEVIRSATSPVTFIVQSLSPSTCPDDVDLQNQESDSEDIETFSATIATVRQSVSSIEEPTEFHQQQMKPELPLEEKEVEKVEDINNTSESEDSGDEFGYTWEKIKNKYGELPGELFLVELEKNEQGLGISLAGNKDRNKASVFVVGVRPGGSAAEDGRIQVGDEILEINGTVLYGRSHQNASAIIKGIHGSTVKLILLRNEMNIDQLAVQPLQFYPTLKSKTELEAEERIRNSPQLTPKRKVQSALDVDDNVSTKHDDTEVTPHHEDYSKFSNVQNITLRKGAGSLGLAIQARDSGIFVKDITVGGAAFQDDRMKVGDQLLAVDNQTLVAISQEKAISILKNTSDIVKLTINGQAMKPVSPVTSSVKCEPIAVPTRTPSPPSDPKTCPITPGKECHILIPKGKTGLGLSIVGGADTLLGAIIVHEVYEDGAAARDGRLWAGDQILEVNSEDLREASHDQAINALRQTPAEVELVVFRDETQFKEEEIYDTITVELNKKLGKGLGLSIVGRRNDTGVFISDIVKGGVAEADGRLVQGDQIYSVNGEDLRNATQDIAAAVLKTTKGKVVLQVGRLKAGSRQSSRRSSHTSQASSQGSNAAPSQHSYQSQGSFDGVVRRVEFHKGPNDSLGLSVAGGVGSPLGDVPLFIASLQPNGLAAKSGKLRIGDRVVSINGENIETTSHTKAVSILKQGTGNIVLEVTQGGNVNENVSSPTTAVSLPTSNSAASSLNEDTTTGDMNIKTVELVRGPDGLGFSIVGGYGSPHGDLPIYVKTVFTKGAASESGQLKRGDQILAVNGETLEDATHDHAVSLLKRCKGKVVLTILT